MTPAATPPVAYAEAARRHFDDANLLHQSGKLGNAGQLFGFAAECGLKAMLLACGVQSAPDGGLPTSHPTNPRHGHPLRAHMPTLRDRIVQNGQLIPDGLLASRYMASMPKLANFQDWSIDHRYWRGSALPLTSVPAWQVAAHEVCLMLDQAKQDGVL